MVTIENRGQYVLIDLSVFVEVMGLAYKHIYLMKDKAKEVKLEKEEKWVEIITSEGSYQLDMNGINGLPAKVDNVIPQSNVELALKLAELKNL